MKRHALAIWIIFAVTTLLAACGSDWYEFISEQGGFAVDMPGDPKVESGFERTGGTSALTTTTYTAAPMFSGESYLVYVGKYSNWSLGGVQFDLEKGKQGMRQAIKNQGGEIISEGPAMLADRNAWEYRITVKGLEGSLRVFVEDMTIYGLQELHKEGKEVTDKAERFFSSFRLLGEA